MLNLTDSCGCVYGDGYSHSLNRQETLPAVARRLGHYPTKDQMVELSHLRTIWHPEVGLLLGPAGDCRTWPDPLWLSPSYCAFEDCADQKVFWGVSS